LLYQSFAPLTRVGFDALSVAPAFSTPPSGAGIRWRWLVRGTVSIKRPDESYARRKEDQSAILT
jgi:hypothetical protein